MPTVNQLAPSDTLFDTFDTPLEQLAQAASIDGASLRHQSSTGFMWGQTDALGSPGLYNIRPGSIIVQGSGFTYGGGGIPNGGTITSISISLGGTVIGGTAFASSPSLEITGLSMNVASLGDEIFAALAGNTEPLETYFASLPWTYNGSNGEDAFEGGSLADTINGNDMNDSLHGNGGADKLYGGGGGDFLYGGAGGDLLSGGEGRDTVRYVDADTAVVASLANPSINKGDAAGDTYQSIENLHGTAFADTLYGNSGDNLLAGYDGNDRLQGGGGNDNLFGLTEDDLLIGGAGADKLDGFTGSDTASYAGSVAGVTVNLLNGKASGGDAAGDTLISIENLTGSSRADSLTGDHGANILSDGGGSGVDTLQGLGGNDTYIVGNSGAVIVEAAGGGSDRVLAAVDYVLKAGVEVETMSTSSNGGTAAIDLTGNSLAQTIRGNAGSNILDGKAGADTLQGLGGKDFFVFSSALGSGNVDTIADFSIADDTVRLENAIFAKLTATGALNAAFFRANSTGTAADGNDYILYDTTDGRLYYDADGNGAGTRIHFATLTGAPAITSADFAVI